MQYSIHLLVQAYILVLTATWGSCWQYFTPLSNIKIHNSELDTRHVHSEYFFGHCRDQKKIFYAHTHIDHMDALGKLIIRGWIDVIRIPTCILLRAKSLHVDLIRSTTYSFQMCVPRISYCHTHQRIKYHYFELYVPEDMIGGMDWELYFYGPPTLSWG